MSKLNTQYIDTDKSLEQYINSLEKQEYIAIDTEFVRETTYYPKLALIQIADKDNIVFIDPIAINNLDPLSQLLFDPDITKVFHAPSQDLEIFYYLNNSIPSPVFDTQIAASLLGIGEQISYAALIKSLLNQDVDKSQTRTNWLKRPLTENQLKYAANDVAFLYQAYPLIKDELSAKGRLEWLDPDFRELCNIDNYKVDTYGVWKKVKGYNSLRNADLVYLRELSKLREDEAMKRDKPRRRILSDTMLIDIARLKPEKKEELQNLREINSSIIDKYGENIITCINKASLTPATEVPVIQRREKPSSQQAALIDTLLSILKIAADQNDITPSMIANRKDIEKLVLGDKGLPLMHGWRYEHAGKLIEDFLAGKITLGYREGQLLLDYPDASN